MKKILKIVPYLVIAVLVGVTVVYAAPISKLLPPGPVSNTMYSLQDIYNLATSGTPATEGSGAIETTPAISETGVTLTQVYEAVETMAENVITSPTFASADETTYTCEALTIDPAQPGLSLGNICGATSGCAWTGSACTGGVQTSVDGKMTWYAAKAACAASTADGQTAGTWRLPKPYDLQKLFIDNGEILTTFQSSSYWSDNTYPVETRDGFNTAYYVKMDDGLVSAGGKSDPMLVYFVRCVR